MSNTLATSYGDSCWELQERINARSAFLGITDNLFNWFVAPCNLFENILIVSTRRTCTADFPGVRVAYFSKHVATGSAYIFAEFDRLDEDAYYV